LTEDKADIGRVLGVPHQVGSDMCYWILTGNGNVIAQTTVQCMTKSDIQEQPVIVQMNAYTVTIYEKLDDSNHVILVPASGLILDDEEEDENDEPEEEPQPNQDDYTKETYDAYLGAELLIPHRDTYILGLVIKRSQDDNDNPTGRRHNNPLLDTR